MQGERFSFAFSQYLLSFNFQPYLVEVLFLYYIYFIESVVTVAILCHDLYSWLACAMCELST